MNRLLVLLLLLIPSTVVQVSEGECVTSPWCEYGITAACDYSHCLVYNLVCGDREFVLPKWYPKPFLNYCTY